MANPWELSTFGLNVINKTQDTLSVQGPFPGDADLTNVQTGKTISPNSSLVVATFNNKARTDCYDWLILVNLATYDWYQIYAEITLSKKPYAFFGFYDSDSSESQSNPYPFPKGCSLVAWDGDACNFDYILISRPAPYREIKSSSGAGLNLGAQP
jgi:hypothetical protein